MRQTSKTIYDEQSNIMLDTSNYDTTPLKIKKLDVKTLLDVNEVLKAGTLLTKAGAKVTTTSTTTDAYYILKNDLDFKGSMSPDATADNACEVGSVLIRGNVIESTIKLDATYKEIEKAALKHIYFGE